MTLRGGGVLQRKARILCIAPNLEHLADDDGGPLHEKTGSLGDYPQLLDDSVSLADALTRCLQTADEGHICRALLSIESAKILILAIPKASATGMRLDQAFLRLGSFLDDSKRPLPASNILCISIESSHPADHQLDASILIACPVYAHELCALPLTEDEMLWLDYAQHPPRFRRTLTMLQTLIAGSWHLWLWRLIFMLTFLLAGALLGRHVLAVSAQGRDMPKDILLTDETRDIWERTHNWSDWYLRIDSGEVARKDHAFEKEWKIQEWFKRHPPSNESVSLWESKDFLRPEKWPVVVNPPQLHFSHCVARVWRYVMARETGQSACSADLNFDHVSHCLNEIIDQYAFPEEVDDLQQVTAEPTLLQWHTRFCLD